MLLCFYSSHFLVYSPNRSLFPRLILSNTDHPASRNCWRSRGIQGHWPSSWHDDSNSLFDNLKEMLLMIYKFISGDKLRRRPDLPRVLWLAQRCLAAVVRGRRQDAWKRTHAIRNALHAPVRGRRGQRKDSPFGGGLIGRFNATFSTLILMTARKHSKSCCSVHVPNLWINLLSSSSLQHQQRAHDLVGHRWHGNGSRGARWEVRVSPWLRGSLVRAVRVRIQPTVGWALPRPVRQLQLQWTREPVWSSQRSMLGKRKFWYHFIFLAVSLQEQIFANYKTILISWNCVFFR